MDVNLSKAVRSNLLSLQNTATMMAKTQERLATGLKVNSAMDNPTNFFTASGLKSRASDLGLLMDSVSNAVQTLSAADKGITAITKLVESAQATSRQALQTSATVTQVSTATAGSITAGAFTNVDISGAGDPGTAATITGAGFASVNVSDTGSAATSASITAGNYSAIDLSGANTLTFSLSVDGGAPQAFTLDAAAVAAYDADNVGNEIGNPAALTGDELAALINHAAGATPDFAASFNGTAIVFTANSEGLASTIEVTAAGGNQQATSGIAVAAQQTGADAVAPDAITFDVAINGQTPVSVTIDDATVAAYNVANGTTLDSSALTAENIATLINDQVGQELATVAGGEIVLSSLNNGTDPTITISNYAAAVTGGATGLGNGNDAGNGVAGTAADAISFSISIDGNTAVDVQIDAAAVTAYNGANGTTFDSSALTAANIAAMINDQVGSNVASVDADSGSLVLTSTSTGANSSVTITNVASATTAGSSGIANGTDAGSAAGVESVVANPKRAELVTQYNELLSQINDLAKDASFNGVNLLNGDELQVIFNEDGSSKLDIAGVTFNAAGLGLETLAADAFDLNSGINDVLSTLKAGIESLRTQASKFGSNLSVVETRQNFTKDMVNVLETGAANLTLADTNEEAANLLALQTRQQLSSTALSMASQADQAVLRLF